eukprot:TRINITY_DN32088_c0_g1_i5.p1 TRINITY_DN32088_c0_g1~~TRINITY_DN32088_c0_g1_i5.p1  ORF type:complete len:304 (-),score=53.11 TRINITY_DN32088_c0_g1_i5:29-940(-)
MQIYRVTADEAERARQTIGKSLPELPSAAAVAGDDASGKAASNVKKGAGSAATSKSGGLGGLASAGTKLGDIAGAAQGALGGSGDASRAEADELEDVPQACAQLQGAFARRVMKESAKDKELFSSGIKHPSTLVGMEDVKLTMKDKVSVLSGKEASGALWVLHSPSKMWFRCFLDGRMKKAMLRCSPHYPKEYGARCGFTKCDMDRTTFKTVCLQGPAGRGFLSSTLLGDLADKCVYMGHSGEMRPFDVAGKPTNYGVFILGCPEPTPLLLAQTCHNGRCSEASPSGAFTSNGKRSCSLAAFL